MMRARNVTGRLARGMLLACAFSLAAAPNAALAQPAPPPAGQAPVNLPTGISESVAAVVNDDIISTYDLAQRMRLLIGTTGVQVTEQSLPQIQRQALVSLVDESLQMQELRRNEREQKMEIVPSDRDIDEELTEMARGNNMTPDQFMAAMRAQGISLSSLRDQLRAQVSWNRWIQIRYGSRLRVGEDQVKATQQRLAADALKPQYEISEVLIDAARTGGMQNAIAGANQLVSQLQQGAPFAAVARQFSASATAANGGDAGWVGPGEMPIEVEQAMEQMRPGQLSQPIPVRDGVYIIYLRDKRAGGAATLYTLKQAAVPLAADATDADLVAATAKLERVRPLVKGCNDIEAGAAKVPGVVGSDLGEAEIKDLSPAFQQAALSLQPGQLSAPIRTPAGLHMIAVCGTRSADDQQLSVQQIENRLRGQQLSMISRRYMRDLRNSATIETR
jgi:peptidyl-prolyl cis-trans isomerase SurA